MALNFDKVAAGGSRFPLNEFYHAGWQLLITPPRTEPEGCLGNSEREQGVC